MSGLLYFMRFLVADQADARHTDASPIAALPLVCYQLGLHEILSEDYNKLSGVKH